MFIVRFLFTKLLHVLVVKNLLKLFQNLGYKTKDSNVVTSFWNYLDIVIKQSELRRHS